MFFIFCCFEVFFECIGKRNGVWVFLNSWVLFLVNELDSGWYIYFWDFILKILKNLIFMNGYRISFKWL